MTDASAFLAAVARRVEAELERRLPAASDDPGDLIAAMRYAALGGGKRLRPALFFAAVQAVGGPDEALAGAALALEAIHTYSLVHDDLPCMDDDDLRRGRPTCHKVYGEATALLAGDALLTVAFAWLAGEDVVQAAGPARTARAVRELAEAAGYAGMVGGQARDLWAEGRTIDLADLEGIHRRKTGALFTASTRLGGLLGGGTEEEIAALGAFGREFGLAFQMVDDLLDEVGEEAAVGKRLGKDRARGKATYPALVGREETERAAAAATERALAALAPFGARADTLRQLARFALARRH